MNSLVKSNLAKIRAAFAAAPSRANLSIIDSEIEGLQEQLDQAMKRRSLITARIDREEDQIANRLDKEIPNWRNLVTKVWVKSEITEKE